jgi:pyrroline-5-carboxylate reductase
MIRGIVEQAESRDNPVAPRADYRFPDRCMKISLIGCGKMGSALLLGIAKKLGAEVSFALHDVYEPAASALAAQLGSRASQAATAAETLSGADVVILAVKPADMQALCVALGAVPGNAQRVYLSIAAGLSIRDLEAWLGHGARVVRSMPNTPALVGEGAAAYSRGSHATAEDAALAGQLLSSVGTADEVSEKLLDAVTGLSGSGPAYGYTIIEALADGGVLMGLPRAAAIRLAAQTMLGAAKMVLESGKHTGQLRDEVTSPGGTTIAGLEALENKGLRSALISAVRAATEKSKVLGGR